MVQSKNIGYKLGSLVVQFKHWQANFWLKTMIIIGALVLLTSVLYGIYRLLPIVWFVLFIVFLFACSSRKDWLNALSSMMKSNKSYEYYGDGPEGYGYYDKHGNKW